MCNDFFETRKPEVLKSIVEEGKLSDETTAALNGALEEFDKVFVTE